MLAFTQNVDSVTYRRDMDEAEAMVTRILRKAPHPTPAASAQPLNAPGAWDFFLSHGQAAAGDAVKTLCLLLKEKKKPNGEPYTVWYDNEMTDRSTAAMEEVPNPEPEPRPSLFVQDSSLGPLSAIPWH